MIATFAIELSLFAYTLVRYKLSSKTRVIGVLLFLLATFQLSEYFVCRSSTSAGAWARVGYMAITLLPALAIHLISIISGRKIKWLVVASYVSSIFFALLFGLSQTTFSGHFCAGNYAIFQLTEQVGGAYFIYYYSWLFIGMALCLYLGNSATNDKRKALMLQLLGYLTFLLPTMIANTMKPETIAGIPSVMCGFAIIYAFILVFGIARLEHK